MIVTRTPYRISFFGGGTDYPAWYQEQGGAVLSTSIDKYCYISCRPLPPFFDHKYRIVYSRIENVMHPSQIEHPAVRAVLGHLACDDGLEVHVDGDLPARSGMGSSSSFTVGLLHAIKALQGEYISHEALARLAMHVEQQVIGESVGSQDQIAAAFGGFNRIDFLRGGGFNVSPVIVPKARLDALQSHLMLFFTGFSRIAAQIAQSQINNLADRHAQLRQMHAMVDEALLILQGHGPLETFGELLDHSWQLKKTLSNKVSNPDIDHLYTIARSAGATGGKLLGAGGGGFMLLFVEPALHAQVRESLRDLVHVPFQFEHGGSRVVLYQPNGL
ncbi:kinase [Pseudomonas fluorescens]|nr:kinase [Pseudomonas fluorescens]OPB09375.1 kinase [Pseudomonas fluorescens]OPB21220.1 kinase [Pseudomonas fluorescens]